ncbi:50S ribosomal protein P1 [Methanomassiliicoccaceae archaeon COG_1]|nr:50S ribosomal protein P1 [Methanomassiliicoccaceae archaeon COG_1]
MQYIYSAMVLYSAGKDITEESVTAVLNAAGATVDPAKVKALVASLEGVDIKEAIANASVAAPVAAAAAPAAGAAPAADAPAAAAAEEEKVSEDEAAAGLSALFG